MDMSRTATGSGWRLWLATILIAASLSWVYVLNGGPIMLRDTPSYMRAGEASLAAVGSVARKFLPQTAAPPASPARAPVAVKGEDGVSDARSPYYGVPLALGNRIAGTGLVMALQCLFAAVALVLALRRLGLWGHATGWAVAAAAVLGGLSFFAIALMPDVFAAPMLVGIAFLVTRTTISGWERLFWILAIFLALLTHRSFIAIAMATILLIVPLWRQSWFNRRGWLMVLATCVAALGAHYTVNFVVERVMKQRMISPPFILARLSDSTLLTSYLDEACPTKRYFLCQFRDRLPTETNAFLWRKAEAGGIYITQDLPGRLRLEAEAGEIVRGAVTARPLQALSEAARDVVHQFFLTGMTDYAARITPAISTDPSFRPTMNAYWQSRIYRQTFPWSLVQTLTTGIYVGALLLGVAVLFALRRSALQSRLAPAFVIFAGLLASAAVTGILSGPFDRYQGRIAWLMPLVAGVLVHAWLQHRRSIHASRAGAQPAGTA